MIIHNPGTRPVKIPVRTRDAFYETGLEIDGIYHISGYMECTRYH